MRLLVLRCKDIKVTADFYSRFGLIFDYHQHGNSPMHYSAMIGNGDRQIHDLINTLQMTVCKHRSVHTQDNPDCTPAKFKACFIRSDPSIVQIAQEFFRLSWDQVNAILEDLFCWRVWMLKV